MSLGVVLRVSVAHLQPGGSSFTVGTRQFDPGTVRTREVFLLFCTSER